MRVQRIILVGLLSILGLGIATSPSPTTAQDPAALPIVSEDIDIMSDGQAFASYIAAPSEGGPYPAIVLIHSFNGMEEGYRTMTDQFAAEGFVVLAVGWQTFERSPAATTMEQLMVDSVAYLAGRADVDADHIGLTGFCAGGYYTMFYLSSTDLFAAGVAWYGFPNNNAGGATPMALADQLSAPMLIIHGTADAPSPMADIYAYATALDAADVYFELKVYQGEPHGFMLDNGQLREDDVAHDAFTEMVDFFTRQLVTSAEMDG